MLDAAWAEALSSAAAASGGLLWYARRRNLQHRSDLVGTSLRVVSEEFPDEQRLEQRITDGGILTQYQRVRTAASAAGFAEVVSFLSSRKVTGSRLLLNVVLRELLLKIEPVVPAPPAPGRTELLRLDAVADLAERYADASFGDGFAVLDDDIREEATSAATTLDVVATPIARMNLSGGIERIGDRMRGDENGSDRQKFASDLVDAARSSTPDASVRTLVEDTLQGISP
jgi:hypothetical protein